MNGPFLKLTAAYHELKDELDAAYHRVMESGLNFSSGFECLVLISNHYDKNAYYREYKDYYEEIT